MSDYPTFETRIVTARAHLGDALRELNSAMHRDYEGDDPTDRQDDAMREGMRLVREARNALAPGTHRLHADPTEEPR